MVNNFEFSTNMKNLSYLKRRDILIVYSYGPGDLGSIPGHVIPKTLKMVLDTSLLNT